MLSQVSYQLSSVGLTGYIPGARQRSLSTFIHSIIRSKDRKKKIIMTFRFTSIFIFLDTLTELQCKNTLWNLVRTQNIMHNKLHKKLNVYNFSRHFLHTKEQSKIRTPKEKVQTEHLPCRMAIHDFAITSLASHSSFQWIQTEVD